MFQRKPVHIANPAALNEMGIHLWVDRLSYFQGRGQIAGWCFGRQRAIREIVLTCGSTRSKIVHNRLPSPDVAAVLGSAAAHCRFDQRFDIESSMPEPIAPSLTIAVSGGRSVRISDLISFSTSNRGETGRVQSAFTTRLTSIVPGRVLELGARNRVSTIGRSLVPSGWHYTGLDIMPGPNVDVVGDAHQLSALFSANTFDAVISIAVFEHLLMPWKVAIEMNRVMKTGAIGFIWAPQTWTVHEEPWDYFRFSKHSWRALFNAATGFAIEDCAQSEPAFVVPRICGEAVNFGEAHVGYLASCATISKISDTALDWPVDLATVVDSSYPQ